MNNRFLVLFATVSLFISCGSRKNAPSPDSVYTQNEQAMLYEYPRLNGYHPNVIKVNPRESEDMFKVQIVPGKQMEIDCNKHGLQGKYERKMLENGDTYFVFLSKGEVFSTKMGCPDNTKRVSFVPGPTIFTAYNSARPFVVYTPTGVDLKYRIWEADEALYNVSNKIDPSVKTDAADLLKAFPESLPGYDRYVLLLTSLPEVQKTTEIKVEIIPGKMEKVDCNTHSLNGNISTKTVEGWGLEYLVFDSDGKYSSTRMGCPDQNLSEKFISGQTQTISYNSEAPTVIFVPKGFEVKYRIWKSPAMVL